MRPCWTTLTPGKTESPGRSPFEVNVQARPAAPESKSGDKETLPARREGHPTLGWEETKQEGVPALERSSKAGTLRGELLGEVRSDVD